MGVVVVGGEGVLVSFLSFSFTVRIQASSVYVVPSTDCYHANRIYEEHILWLKN